MRNVYIWEANHLLIICYINNAHSNSTHVYAFVYMDLYGKMMVLFKNFLQPCLAKYSMARVLEYGVRVNAYSNSKNILWI